jgi:hypothetical protein
MEKMISDEDARRIKVPVCKCGWAEDHAVHHGLPREEAHAFEVAS